MRHFRYVECQFRPHFGTKDCTSPVFSLMERPLSVRTVEYILKERSAATQDTQRQMRAISESLGKQAAGSTRELRGGFQVSQATMFLPKIHGDFARGAEQKIAGHMEGSVSSGIAHL